MEEIPPRCYNETLHFQAYLNLLFHQRYLKVDNTL